jgi:16S rRNA (cytosine1402-N4)-methyltransferase
MGVKHLPVMGREVVSYLGCVAGRTYLDCTLGGGGHALEILQASAPDGRLIGIDQDGEALAAAESALKPYKRRVTLVRENFRRIKDVLADLGIKSVDGILLDLGVSSFQLDSADRGFSFRTDSALDMRMDQREESSARDLVNDLDADELSGIFKRYGEERFSSRIARAIVNARAKSAVETTGELSEIVSAAIPKKFHPKRIHPATKVFQALRIAVNDELESLKCVLADGIGLIAKGGRFVVISFHSLEDRLVKNFFRDSARGCICPPRAPVCACGKLPVARLLTRKVVVASSEEVEANPRARSARLRAIEKI